MIIDQTFDPFSQIPRMLIKFSGPKNFDCTFQAQIFDQTFQVQKFDHTFQAPKIWSSFSGLKICQIFSETCQASKKNWSDFSGSKKIQETFQVPKI